MPSAYTAAVYDGLIEDFESFAWRISRAFMHSMKEARDEDPYSRPIKAELEEDMDTDIARCMERIEQDQAQLQKYQDLPDAGYQDILDQRYKELDPKQVAYFHLHNDRLQKMIGKAEAWQPPTVEHKRIKEYMLEQLRASIPHKPELPDEEVPTLAKVKEDLIDSAERALKRSHLALATTKRNNMESLAWVDAFEASIKGL